jgi:hypothetical protein
MTEADRKLAEFTFNYVFKPASPFVAKLETCEFDNDTVVVDGLTIREIKDACRADTVLGPSLAPGYMVETTMHRSNYPHEPDDADVVQVGGAQQYFGQALRLAASHAAALLADVIVEAYAAGDPEISDQTVP